MPVVSSRGPVTRVLAALRGPAALAVAVLAGPASACIHTESDYGGTVTAPRQEYAAFWNEGREVLLISTAITSDSGAPEALSLVTATPSLPSDITTGDPALFPALAAWLDPASKGIPGTFGDAGPSDGGNGISVLPTVQAGPYSVTPIEASGTNGVTELNAWLSGHGFRTLSAELAQYYADEGWYFLAVGIAPATAGGTLDDGALPPLQLTFDSSALVVPLKLEAGMAPFAARVYAFAGGELPASAELGSYGMEVAPVGARTFDGAPTEAQTLIAALQGKGLVPTDAAGWRATGIRTVGALNEPGRMLSEWATDFRIAYPLDVPATGEDVSSPGADVGQSTGGADAASSGDVASSSSGSSSGCSTGPASPGSALLALGLILLVLRRKVG